MRLLPLLSDYGMQPLVELGRQFVELIRFVEGDRISDIVYDHLAWIASYHVLLELLTYGLVDRAVDKLVQVF